MNFCLKRLLKVKYYKAFCWYSMDLSKAVNVLESFAPLSLAEPWDNVGLLLQPSEPHLVKKVFLTNDLTEPVLDEARHWGMLLMLEFLLKYLSNDSCRC